MDAGRGSGRARTFALRLDRWTDRTVLAVLGLVLVGAAALLLVGVLGVLSGDAAPEPFVIATMLAVPALVGVWAYRGEARSVAEPDGHGRQ